MLMFKRGRTPSICSSAELKKEPDYVALFSGKEEKESKSRKSPNVFLSDRGNAKLVAGSGLPGINFRP